MTLEVPVKPISVNVCWQGRRFATPAYKQWRKDGLTVLLLYKNKKELKGDLGVAVTLYLKRLYQSDCDNYLKPILDLLVQGKVIKDDRYIMELGVKKVKSNIERFEVEVYQI